MKYSVPIFSTLLVSLTACQYVPYINSTEKGQEIPQNLEQLFGYGANFASEYKNAATETCASYAKLYQEGDWHSGWILALQVTEPNNSCVNSEQAIQILTTLEKQKKIYPELLWLTHVHLSWLKGLEKVNQLKHAYSLKQSQMSELKQERQDLVGKIDALKAIETSIDE